MKNVEEKQQMIARMQTLLDCIPASSLRTVLKVLTLAVDLAANGREDKPASAMFIIGDEEWINKYTLRLVLNPFEGYLKQERDIFANDLDETLKEFSRLDGAICIDNEGIVFSARTTIAPPQDKEIDLYRLGPAHHAAALLTAAISDCVAVKVSSGVVRVICHGKILIEL